jgi:hypothetical protein
VTETTVQGTDSGHERCTIGIVTSFAHDPEEVHTRAARLAEAIGEAGSLEELSGKHRADYDELVAAVARTAPRFAFDRAGRPGAIDAVRAALPVVERELFDAILDDHACEVAAVEEALFQLARACAARRSSAEPARAAPRCSPHDEPGG